MDDDSRSFRLHLAILFVIVALNYVAQVPYYVHQYLLPSHSWPSIPGAVMLLGTLAWFVAAHTLLRRHSKAGLYLMVGYLTTVFVFYLQTQVSQLIIRHQLFLYVYRPTSPVLFLVFGIGYVNFVASAYFAWYFFHNRNSRS